MKAISNVKLTRQRPLTVILRSVWHAGKEDHLLEGRVEINILGHGAIWRRESRPVIAFRGGSENKALSRISEALGPGVTGYHCTWGFYRKLRSWSESRPGASGMSPPAPGTISAASVPEPIASSGRGQCAHASDRSSVFEFRRWSRSALPALSIWAREAFTGRCKRLAPFLQTASGLCRQSRRTPALLVRQSSATRGAIPPGSRSFESSWGFRGRPGGRLQ